MSGQTSTRSDPPTGPSRTAPDPPPGAPPFPVPPPLVDPPATDKFNASDANNSSSSAVIHTSKGLPPIPPLMSVGPKHVASGGTTSSSRLPSPPKFPYSTTSAANSSATASIKTGTSMLSSTSSLPPPPKLSMPINLNSGSNHSDYNNSSNNLSDANPNDSRFAASDKTSKGKNAEKTIHATTEQIPPLSSAPNSGGSFTRDVLGYDAGGQEHSFATSQNTTESSAASFFAAPAVSSSDNWSQWGGSLMEKAGKLAYSTVGSAVDLVGVEKNSMSYYYDGVNGTGEKQYPFSQESPDPPKEEVAFGTQTSFISIETPDPATYPSFSAGGHFPSPPLINNNMAADTYAPITPSAQYEDQGIEIGADGRAPSASPRRVPPSSNFELDVEPITTTDFPHKHDTQRRQRALANPSITSLAGRQSHLTVLVVPTAEAQSIASKNNTTLTEMFRVFGNSNAHSTPNVRGLDPGTSQQQNDLILEPPLPPFRSANRSMMLHWDQIVLNFVSGQEMEDMPVAEAEAEKALAEAARLWDEDQNLHVEGSDGNSEEDAELNELEKCVVEALAEEEEEQRIRKADGIPSMTSWPPPRSRKQSRSDGEDAEGKDHEYASAFENDEEDALKSCADSAFALTALPSAPWLARFRHTLDCSTDGMGHDMLCNPAAVILAASSSEPFLTCFAELANVHHLPRPYHDGRYDPNGLRREFLLLHDVSNGPKQFDDARALAQMRERFGAGCCSILRINSLHAVQNNTKTEDVEWENAGPPSPFVGGSLSERYKPSIRNDQNIVLRGTYLSLQDKRSIRRYIANMVATGLVPAIERRIAVLNSAVTNAKKGVKNVIKSFWRKPKENLLVNVSGYGDGNSGRGDNSSIAGDGTHGSVKYRYDSIESQTRLLADTLFLMRDYDAALGMYKLVKDDYKHDRAMLHYASVQEMIVLCMHMLDPYGRENRFTTEVHHSIETALYSYTRAADDEREAEGSSGSRPGEAPHATRLATRLCLVISAARALCQGKHMEIADLLASASSHETPLGAAVLLEQSSSHYHHAGMQRKYAFHMLMAGHMFRSAGQERHSFRCFSASLFVYHGERWEELKSHLRSAIAAQLYGMGRYALSMQFYAKLISMTGGGRVSVRSQQKFLNHIIDICKGHQSSALLAVDRINGATQGVTSSGTTDVLVEFSGAARTLEISNVGFPCVKESSISVRVENISDSSALFGHSDSINAVNLSEKGDETIWQDMMNYAEAELRAAIVSSTTSNIEVPPNDGAPAPPLVSSGNEEIDRVITEIDKEERAAEYKARIKRKGNLGAPEVRATHEPLAVSFSLSNPLGLDIDLIDVQLVASLACKQSGMIHTSEFSMSTKGRFNSTHNAIWQFHGSEKVYSRPEFLRQQPMTSEHFDTQSSEIDDNPEPYFVVTKLNTKIKSNSEARITLNICPLVKGNFNIHGFRFKLLGEVWMYHQFDLRGPLLQDSQTNRARRARGESLVLKSKVEREMPFLQVDITPNRTDPNSQGVVLQGQTSSWTLKITNLGYAPACNIMLKTNSPWLNISSCSEPNEQNENDSTSHCIGPSGTLMRIPFNTFTADCNSDSSNTLGILQPGETAEVPVVIRTSGGGRQDFFMLVRYELWCNEYLSSNLIPRHRWVRKLLSFPVYPSITMSASLMPSYSNKGEHILSIELMNYRSDRESNLEIYLNKIFIASRHFKVRQLSGQVDVNDEFESPTPCIDSDPATHSLKIGWQERVTLHYLVIPLENLEKPTFTLSTLSFSTGNNDHSISSGDVKHCNEGHITDFMCRERAFDAFSSSLQAHKVEKERQQALQEKEGQPRHVAQIRRARTSMPIDETSNSASIVKSTPGSGALPVCPTSSSAHPTSVSSLCPINGSSNINIICSWSAQVGNDEINETIIGQHHLRSLLVRPQNKSKGCPLALTAKHATKASHNFIDSPLDVDLKVSLRNRLVENSVEFEFALDHQSGFDFIGATCFKWTLAGGEEITIPLKARFYCKGVYNLQSVRLTVLKAGVAVPYLFPLQWTIEVEDKI